MKKKFDLLGLFLALTAGIALLAVILLRTFLPRLILPKTDASTLVAVSLIALVLNHWFCKAHRIFWLVPLYGAWVFGLFTLAAGVAAPLDALHLAGLGAVIFTVVTFLFDTMTDRLSSGPVAKAAPLVSAFGLYLAAQCLMGII